MSNYYKYGRTYHLPWSLGYTNDDKVLDSVDHFIGRRIIITEKMDGENTSMYSDKIHARSIDSKHHESRNWVKGFHGMIKHEIPEGWRICGENLYAKHSIFYDNLVSYFLGFSVFNEQNICLNWDETLKIFDIIGIQPVPVLFDGIFNEHLIKEVEKSMDFNKQEGYVIRVADSFHYNDFSNNIAKFVRINHVTTNEHWMFSKIIQNKLKSDVAL